MAIGQQPFLEQAAKSVVIWLHRAVAVIVECFLKTIKIIDDLQYLIRIIYTFSYNPRLRGLLRIEKQTYVPFDENKTVEMN